MSDAFDSIAPNVVKLAPGFAYDSFINSDEPLNYPGSGPFYYSDWSNYLNELEKYECAPCVDKWAIHWYDVQPGYWNFQARLNDFKSYLAPHGWQNMQVCVTETGARYGPAPQNQPTQAAQMTSRITQIRNAGISCIYIYSGLTQPNQDPHGLTYAIPTPGTPGTPTPYAVATTFAAATLDAMH